MSEQSYAYAPQTPIAVPGDVASLLANSGLGSPLASYQVPKQIVGGIALLLIGGFVALSSLCTGALLGTIVSHVDKGAVTSNTLLLVGGVGIAVLLSLAMAWIGIYMLVKRPQRIYLCNGGIVIDEKRGLEALRWEYIASVSRYWTHRRQHDNADRDRFRTVVEYHCLLTLSDGQTRSIEESDYKEGKVLGAEIARQVTRILLPQALAAYQAGQTLSFGNLSVSRYGLSQDQGRSGLPWNAFSALQLGRDEETRDEIALVTAQDDKPWYVAKRMPNVLIFAEIARMAGVPLERTLWLPNTALEDLAENILLGF